MRTGGKFRQWSLLEDVRVAFEKPGIKVPTLEDRMPGNRAMEGDRCRRSRDREVGQRAT